MGQAQRRGQREECNFFLRAMGAGLKEGSGVGDMIRFVF